jgi:hypothetical protein
VDREEAGVARLVGARLVLLDDDEAGAIGAQRLCQRHADAAEAADDDVFGQLIDL